MKLLLPITLAATLISSAFAQSPVLDAKINTIEGKETSLAEHKGKVILVVNTASKCGFTKQYAGLEALFESYKDKGLVVAGFPCNQFRGQEPGTNAEIAAFCTEKFGVTFPMYSKIEVNGADRHPLYTALAGEDSPFAGDIKWNFTKFLIGKDGEILGRFESKVTPDSPELKKAIEAALAAE